MTKLSGLLAALLCLLAALYFTLLAAPGILGAVISASPRETGDIKMLGVLILFTAGPAALFATFLAILALLIFIVFWAVPKPGRPAATAVLALALLPAALRLFSRGPKRFFEELHKPAPGAQARRTPPPRPASPQGEEMGREPEPPPDPELLTIPFPLPLGTAPIDEAKARNLVPGIGAALALKPLEPLPQGFDPAPLLDGLRHPDYSARTLAAQSLGNLYLQPLRPGLDPAGAGRAASALLAAMRERAQGLDVGDFLSPSEQKIPSHEGVCFASRAAWSLVLIGGPAEPALLEAVRAPGSTVFHHILSDVLGRRGAVFLADALGRETDPAIRRRLAKGVAFGGPAGDEARRRLNALLEKEKDPVVGRLISGPLHTVYAPAPGRN